jgi:cation:H+ antiporter
MAAMSDWETSETSMITILQFAGGFVLLLFGAEYLVRGAVSLARQLNVSPMIIGMTIVAYGTTSPELVVSLQAAIDGLPGISVGNVVGSNIANILLILGASAVIFPIVVKPKTLYRDAAVMMGSALLFTALALNGIIARWQGVLMVAALIVFSLYAFQAERKRGKANDPGDLPEELADEFKDPPQATWLAVLSIIGGVASVVVGAKLLVTAAVTTARYFGVGEEVIGLTIVAVGTSLPELATAVVAAIRRHSEVAVGNILGAGIYNLLAIMGLVATVSPIPVPSQILAFDLWFMLATTAVLLFFLLMRGGLNRVVAVSFLFAFAGYTALQYYGVDKMMALTPAPAVETARTK